MQQYKVTGMSCAACSARVEKAVSKVEGVTSCNVNLLTNSMTVEGSSTETNIINAVTGAGYGIISDKKENVNGEKSDGSDEIDREIRKLKLRLFTSLFFLLVLMYFSMGYTMWDFPLPKVMEKNQVMIAFAQLLLTITVMVINQKFFVSGFKGLIKLAPNMDTLVALGSTAAFSYSTYILFLMIDALYECNMINVTHYMHDLYFE